VLDSPRDKDKEAQNKQGESSELRHGQHATRFQSNSLSQISSLQLDPGTANDNAIPTLHIEPPMQQTFQQAARQIVNSSTQETRLNTIQDCSSSTTGSLCSSTAQQQQPFSSILAQAAELAQLRLDRQILHLDNCNSSKLPAQAQQAQTLESSPRTMRQPMRRVSMSELVSSHRSSSSNDHNSLDISRESTPHHPMRYSSSLEDFKGQQASKHSTAGSVATEALPKLAPAW
jgi:hypothetical protein